MANLGFITLEKNEEYVNLEDLMGLNLTSGKTYQIQIQGSAVFCESEEKPVAGGTYWNLIKPFDYLKKDESLWVLVQSDSAYFNVSE